MSLTDGDKVGDTRANPALNVDDVLQKAAVKAHATEGTAYRQEQSVQDVPRLISKDDQIILFDGVANKAVIGRDGAGNWTIKMAVDGTDVLTASDEDLIFDIARNTLQVHGGVRFATIAAQTYGNGSHDDHVDVDISSLNLSEKPMILAFYRTGASAASLGDRAWGGCVIDFIDASGPANLRAFTYLNTFHTATNARFERRFVNCSAAENLTTPQYNIAFIICTQSAS